MRFLYNKLEQKKNVGLFANGSYKLAFLLKKIPFNNLSHGRWTYVLLVEPELSTVFFLEAKYVEQGNKGANSDTELQNISCYRETLKVSVRLIDLVTVSDAILTSWQTCEKLQCLYENLMSNNFRKTAFLKKISVAN